MGQLTKDIAELIVALGNGDYTARLDRKSAAKEEDAALIVGLNMLAEELEVMHAEQLQHIDDMKETNRKLIAAQSRLVEQEKLATLGRLAALVSHELRNPLGTIQMSAATLRQISDETRRVRALDRIDRNVIRCSNIIEELLDYTRRPHGDKEPTALDPWLAEVVREILLLSDVPLTLNLTANAHVDLHPTRLAIGITNLVLNAQDAVNSVKDRECHGITITTHTTETSVVITVADDGIGMDDKERASMFEPLFSTKAAGIGLGLPITKQVVEEHDGTLAVWSAPGEGTRITLTLLRSELEP